MPTRSQQGIRPLVVAGVDFARSFNGSSDSITASPNLSAYNKASVAFWLNWTTFANDDDLAMEYSTNYGTHTGGFIVDLNSSNPNPGTAYLGWNGGGALITASFARPSAGAWHHYLFLIDGTVASTSAIPAIYVDGVSQSLTYGGTPSTGNLGNYALYLMSRAGASLFGAGSMADIALWGGVLLNATQAANLAAGRRANTIGANANLVDYLPILGQSPEPDKSGNGFNGVLTGTTVVSGPPTLDPFVAAPVWQGPTSTLTHRWQMDSGSISGGVVHDLVGSDDGTISGTPTNVASPSGAFASTALAFNGSTDFLTLASNPITLGGPYTVAFWLNLPDITFVPQGAGTDSRFYNFTNGAAIALAVNATTNLPGAPSFVDSGNEFPAAAAQLVNNTWVHLAFTLSSGTGLLYVNGSSVSVSGTNTGDTGTTTANIIAARGDGQRWTKGSFYQFVTYSSALSPTDITTLYNAK